MRSLSTVFIAVLLALTAAHPHPRYPLAIPIQKRSTLTKDGIANLDALRSHLAYSEGKYLQGLSALERDTSVPRSFSSGQILTRRSGGAELLTDNGNERWWGTISVGTPAKKYKVDFDTGSADTFIPASYCNSTCAGHTLYNPNASSSAVDLHRSFVLSYGDGSTVVGDKYVDTVSISGFMATNQTIGAASQYSTGFQSANFAPDGLMGMGFANISVFEANPVVQTLITEGQLPDPVFAFKLDSSASELLIGGFDSSYTGSLTYTPVTQQGYWQIGVDSINANGHTVNKNVIAIVDTGTTFILGGAGIVDEFYRGLNATNVGGGFYTSKSYHLPMPCNAMPNISITTEGTTFPISAETFNLGSYNSSDDCVGAIVGSGSLGVTWILGDTFLRNVYSVFDVGGLRVGFASLA